MWRHTLGRVDFLNFPPLLIGFWLDSNLWSYLTINTTEFVIFSSIIEDNKKSCNFLIISKLCTCTTKSSCVLQLGSHRPPYTWRHCSSHTSKFSLTLLKLNVWRLELVSARCASGYLTYAYCVVMDGLTSRAGNFFFVRDNQAQALIIGYFSSLPLLLQTKPRFKFENEERKIAMIARRNDFAGYH